MATSLAQLCALPHDPPHLQLASDCPEEWAALLAHGFLILPHGVSVALASGIRLGLRGRDIRGDPEALVCGSGSKLVVGGSLGSLLCSCSSQMAEAPSAPLKVRPGVCMPPFPIFGLSQASLASKTARACL